MKQTKFEGNAPAMREKILSIFGHITGSFIIWNLMLFKEKCRCPWISSKWDIQKMWACWPSRGSFEAILQARWIGESVTVSTLSGSPALAKVRDAILGPNNSNLNDLGRLDGNVSKMYNVHFAGLRKPTYFHPAFLHTGDCEAVNALLLKYMPKRIAFR